MSLCLHNRIDVSGNDFLSHVVVLLLMAFAVSFPLTYKPRIRLLQPVLVPQPSICAE